jgi:hypothetical protein
VVRGKEDQQSFSAAPLGMYEGGRARAAVTAAAAPAAAAAAPAQSAASIKRARKAAAAKAATGYSEHATGPARWSQPGVDQVLGECQPGLPRVCQIQPHGPGLVLQDPPCVPRPLSRHLAGCAARELSSDEPAVGAATRPCAACHAARSADSGHYHAGRRHGRSSSLHAEYGRPHPQGRPPAATHGSSFRRA